MKYIAAVIVAIAIVIVAALAFVYSGIYNVAADVPHWQLTVSLLHDLRERSIQSRAKDIRVPPLDKPKMIEIGAWHYEHMCSGCHLSPGERGSEIREGLYPRPPNLTLRKHNPAAEFWIIKHGIKLTGMPAWGKSHSDAKIWAIVAFLQQLPDMSRAQYQALAAASAQTVDEHGHEHERGHGHADVTGEQDEHAMP